MARKDGKDRGLFKRPGDKAWWIRWTCPYQHEHRERIGPKYAARAEYERRRVQVRTEGFCLDRAREQRPTTFRKAEARYMIWAEAQVRDLPREGLQAPPGRLWQ